MMALFTTAAIILGGLAAAGLGIGFLTGQLGSAFAGIEGFISFIFLNIIEIALVGGVIAFAAIAVKNAGQDEPLWRQDLGFMFGGLIALIVLVFLVQAGTAATTQYKADMKITAKNPVLGEPIITSVSVQEDTFEEESKTASILSRFSAATSNTASLFDDVSGSYSVSCGGSQVDRGSFRIRSVAERNTGTTTVTLHRLPSGAECTVTVDAENTAKTSFTVPK